MKAAARGRTRLVRFLLGKRASVHARDHHNLTALYVATGMSMSRQSCGPSQSDFEMYLVLKALLDAGADINAEWGSQNLLMTAYLGKHHELVSFLVEHGATCLPGSGPWEEVVPLVSENTHRHAGDGQPGSSTSETWSIEAQYSSDTDDVCAFQYY